MAQRFMFNAKTGTRASVPVVDEADPSEAKAKLSRMRVNGFRMFVELIGTRDGHLVMICCEPHIDNGQADEKALGLKRKDKGHIGEPAFMEIDAWKALGEARQKKMVQPPPLRTGTDGRTPVAASAQAKPGAPDPAIAAQLAALQAQIDELKAGKAAGATPPADKPATNGKAAGATGA